MQNVTAKTLFLLALRQKFLVSFSPGFSLVFAKKKRRLTVLTVFATLRRGRGTQRRHCNSLVRLIRKDADEEDIHSADSNYHRSRMRLFVLRTRSGNKTEVAWSRRVFHYYAKWKSSAHRSMVAKSPKSGC